jgi:hypothetical protein
VSADPRPAELTVPMAVLERWLLKAFEAGKVAAPYAEYQVVWKLAADGTLSPLLVEL